jgi:serine/threonine protein kinase
VTDATRRDTLRGHSKLVVLKKANDVTELIDKLVGSYTILEVLRKGPRGSLYRARQESMGREVALRLLPRPTDSADFAHTYATFEREARIVATMQHPHILPVYDFGGWQGQPYIVTALMPGGTLAATLAERGKLPLPEALRYLRQLADALDYAHSKGIIHRDVNPRTIVLDSQLNGRHNAYLADFSLATNGSAAPTNDEDDFLTTPEYMAPDWSNSDEALTHAADIYALGVVLYEMLTGTVPFTAENPMGVLMAHLSDPVPDVRFKRPELPEEVNAVVGKALAKSPAQRFESAGRLASAFEDAVRQPIDLSETPAVLNMREQFFYPNWWGRAILEGVAETIGEDEMEIVLIQADLGQYVQHMPPDNHKKEFAFEHYSRLVETLYRVYGSRGLRSIGRYAGKRTYEAGSTHYEALFRVGEAYVREADEAEKVLTALKYFAQMFNTISDQRVNIEEGEGCYEWRSMNCAMCFGRKSADPLGYIGAGIIEGLLEHLNGSSPRITEVKCIAQGDPYGMFCIDKTDKPPVP